MTAQLVAPRVETNTLTFRGTPLELAEAVNQSQPYWDVERGYHIAIAGFVARRATVGDRIVTIDLDQQGVKIGSLMLQIDATEPVPRASADDVDLCEWVQEYFTEMAADHAAERYEAALTK